MMPEASLMLARPSRSQQIDTSVFFLIAVAMAVYLVVRAILVPMAHDEIATFYYFVQSGKISPFLSNIDTNNHFLNSALTWVFYHLFGPSPLALRLSNLVFIPVFFYFLLNIARHLTSRVLKYTFFITIAFTLHFIEFLALSRGYGMSMSMLLASLFFLIEGLSTLKVRNFTLSLISIFIACLANLALINSYALILFFIGIHLVLNHRGFKKNVSAIFILAGILPFSIIIIQILYIKINAGLIAGSPANFWATTITSLFSYLFETSHSLADFIAASLFVLIATAGTIALLKIRKINLILNSNTFLFFYLFAGNIAIILILGTLFRVNYPDDRIGVYLYPLAIGSLIFTFDQLLKSTKSIILFSVPFLVIPLHFFIFLNTSYSIWYKYDVIPQRFYSQVMQSHKTGEYPPTIAGHGLRIFCWSYLNYMHGGMASQFFFTHFPDYNADFQIVNLKMIPAWQTAYDTIDYDPVSERHLLKRHTTHKYYPLITKSLQSVSNNSAEFVILAEGPADSLRNKSLKIDIALSLLSVHKPFNSRVVFDVWDNQQKSLGSEYIQFNWLRNSWDGSYRNFTNCMLAFKIPPEASTYRMYIWNIDKTEYSITDGLISIYEMK